MFSDFEKNDRMAKSFKNQTLSRIRLIIRMDSFSVFAGTVGDWRNYFTVAQNEMFDREYNDKMKGTGLNFDFELKK